MEWSLLLLLLHKTITIIMFASLVLVKITGLKINKLLIANRNSDLTLNINLNGQNVYSLLVTNMQFARGATDGSY